MIIDSSAIVAIVLKEPGYQKLYKMIQEAENVGVGAPTLVETVSFTEHHYSVAMDAFRAYGKGRHPARLNFGDCMSYAAAKVAGLPLIFIGDDFTKTDLVLA